jgi:hypothetical protein
MITGLAVYAFIRFWLPIASAVALAGKLFLVTRKAVTNAKAEVSQWANTLLDNHMTHIQDSAEKAAAAVVELAEFHKGTISAQERMVDEMQGVRSDLAANNAQLLNVQHQILTGIEVIKAKVD